MLALTPHRVSVDSDRKWSKKEVKNWSKADVMNWLTTEDVSSEDAELLTETCLSNGRKLVVCTYAIMLENIGQKKMLRLEMATAWDSISDFQKELLSNGDSGAKN